MWALIRVTYLEGLRSRIFFGVFLFSLLMIGASLVFTHLFMHNLAKIAVDFNLAGISFAGLLLSLSFTANSISKDIQNRTIYFILARPISRIDYIFGKFLGITLLTLFVYITLLSLASITLFILSIQYSNVFENFSWLALIQATFLDFLKICLFNSLILFFSIITSSSFITMLFAISSYVIGQSLNTVVEFLDLKQNTSVDISVHSQPFLKFINFIFPNFGIFDTKLLAAHGITIPLTTMLVYSAYSLIYSVLLLLIASLIFTKKELS